MTLLVVGTDCAVARALHDARPVDQVAGAMNELRAHRPDQIALVALPPSVGPIGALAPAAFAELAHDTLTLSLSVVQAAAQLEGPVRIALICPADAIHPDHLDGARSVIGAGLTMLAEVSAQLPTVTINAIAVADDVPAEEVAALTRFVLSGQTPSLNGTTMRLDGGHDAVLAAETRAEGA